MKNELFTTQPNNWLSWLKRDQLIEQPQANSMKLNYRELFFIGLLVVITVMTTTDLVIDYYEESDAWHLAIEALVIVLSLAGLGYLIKEAIARRRELESLTAKLEYTEQSLSESREHVRNANRAYSEVIQKQLDDWQLTPSEKDVAVLLLKGLSFDEIASVRKTKEKTVRQQATAIYRKSNLNGRHEFAAWFFEDFLQ